MSQPKQNANKPLAASYGLGDWVDLCLAGLTGGTKGDSRLVLALIIANQGSTPRDQGSWMLVNDARFWGTLGGGELEYRAQIAAGEMIAGKLSWQRQSLKWILGPDLGQCCGGAVDVMLLPVDKTSLPWLKQAKAAQDAGQGACYLALPAAADAPPIVCDQPDMASGDYIHFQPLMEILPQLYIFGGGHVGAAIAQTASCLPLSTYLVDGRADILADFTAPLNCKVMAGDPLVAMQQVFEQNSDDKPARPIACVILTHNHDLDYDLGLYALSQLSQMGADQQANYWLGIIGSKTKTARFYKRYGAETSISQTALQQLNMPIAKDGPNGKEPSLIALSLLHQLFIHWRGAC